MRWFGLLGVTAIAACDTLQPPARRDDITAAAAAPRPARDSDSGSSVPTLPTSGACQPPPADVSRVRFAVIGDYGASTIDEGNMAKLVAHHTPDFIVTTGDNNYPAGARETIDLNIGAFFHDYICPYRGTFGAGAELNRFFPSLGNHDWMTPGAAPYLEYFTLPGNERYYETVWGPVHLFSIDSDPNEPDGVTSDSVQAQWLKDRLAQSSARWKVVYMHHPPFSSGLHGSSEYMRWPFREWGASLVMAGHDHTYERVVNDGLTYIVSGLGGRSLYAFENAAPGSEAKYNAKFGAVIIAADPDRLTSRFYTVDGELVDEVVLGS